MVGSYILINYQTIAFILIIVLQSFLRFISRKQNAREQFA